MKLRNLLFFTGGWIYLPLSILLFFGIKGIGLTDQYDTIITCSLLVLVLFGLTKTAMINARRYRNGHCDFSFSDAIGCGKREIREGQIAQEAMYPPIPTEYISSMPRDLVLGKHKGQYVYCPLGDDGVMGFIVGAPGAHKTVLLLSWLYTVFYREKIYGSKKKKAGKNWNAVIVDVKGEIYRKLFKIKGIYRANGNNRLQVFQPSNRLSYGWDVFYMLRGHTVTPTIRLKAVQDIADSLIEESKNNPYFSNNAKKILMGVLFYYSQQGEDFIPIMKRLNESPTIELITEIVKNARLYNDSITLGMLAGFVGKDDNESIQDVESTLKQSLQCFLYPDIVYALYSNPYRTSPRVLNGGRKSIDIAIEESMLPVYRPVFRLLCVQVLRHAASEFKEDDKRMTSLIYDEAAAIKRIPELENVMATCRSKHVNILLIFQNRNQFDDLYGKEVSESILNLCELKLFLSNGGDKKTEEYVQTMAGKYIDKKHSYSKDGLLVKNMNVSDEEKQIVDGRELMSLRARKEMIAFIYGRYFRFKKIIYFEDEYLAPIAKAIKKHNDRYTVTNNGRRFSNEKIKVARNTHSNAKHYTKQGKPCIKHNVQNRCRGNCKSCKTGGWLDRTGRKYGSST